MENNADRNTKPQTFKLGVYKALLILFVILSAVFFALWRSEKPMEFKIGFPEIGDPILPTDYKDMDNWLEVQKAADKPVDVFFIYPTSWRAKPGEFPISGINNPEMRHWAKYYLDTRASAFETAGNVYAPYYRQLDASFAVSQQTTIMTSAYFAGVPYTDIRAAFDYYIKNFNGGRPFILAAHSQGSAMGLLLLLDYMKERPDVYKRMVAAYLIGAPIIQTIYDQFPHLKAAQRADDTGVIISYNTQAPVVDAPGNLLANPNSVLINPVSWRIDGEKIEADQSKGSVEANEDTNELVDLGSIADAQLDQSLGAIITNVDREKFSSAAESRSYFPLGVFHENDIPLFYYDLRANAELRARTFLEK
jgi:pimeloyl-ACP methyl ester carboxylesterase